MKVAIRHQAQRDIDELAAYIADRNLDAGIRFYDAIEKALELISQFPEIGTSCEFQHPEAADLRVWPIRGFENHLIFYRPLPARIQVERVLQGSRDLGDIFEPVE